MRKTRCSIVITAYNVDRYIKQCVDSALNQTEPCEVVVVADDPTDNTKDILASYGKKIKLVNHLCNEGAGQSRRDGISHATSEFVLLLDGDDYIDRDFVKQLVAKADKTGADIVSGGIRVLNEDGSWNATSYGECITEGRDKVARFWGERIVFMNNKIIRRSLYDAVPYCGRRYIEDTPTIIPLMFLANKVAYVDNIGYTYRMNPDSLTHTTNLLKDLIYKGLCWLDLFEFFNERDKEMFNVLDVIGYLRNIIGTLNKVQVTQGMVLPYKAEWDEFVMRLLNTIEITNVNIVDGVKGCN